MIWVALSTVKDPAALLPNLTAVAPEKLVPVMVTLLPPDVGPVFGLMLVTVGAAAGARGQEHQERRGVLTARRGENR